MKDEQYAIGFVQSPWEQLKQYTDARIALGRAGGSLPTQVNLDFQLAHAQAKDAVLKYLNIQELKSQLTIVSQDIMTIESCAEDKDVYLKRPDLGRVLCESSRQKLQEMAASTELNYDVVIVIADGLSARAIEENVPYFVPQFVLACEQQGWNIAPLVIATGSRVALGDEIAQILKAKMLVMLIGERPGLSSPDSMGIYYTYDAFKGIQDAARNCISNVRSAGLAYSIAIQRLIALMQKSVQLQLSGVRLKDEYENFEIDNTKQKNRRLF